MDTIPIEIFSEICSHVIDTTDLFLVNKQFHQWSILLTNDLRDWYECLRAIKKGECLSVIKCPYWYRFDVYKALHKACKYGRLPIIKFLTPKYQAIIEADKLEQQNNRYSGMKILKNPNNDINPWDSVYGQENASIINYLDDLGIEFNGSKAACYAARHGYFDRVQELYQRYSCVTKHVLYQAARSDHTKMISWLLKKSNTEEHVMAVCCGALRGNRVELFRAMFLTYVRRVTMTKPQTAEEVINGTTIVHDCNWVRLLSEACRGGNLDLMKLLYKRGTSSIDHLVGWNGRDNVHSDNKILSASRDQHAEHMRYILDRLIEQLGQHGDYKQFMGLALSTLLTAAMMKGIVNMSRLLLEYCRAYDVPINYEQLYEIPYVAHCQPLLQLLQQ